VYQEYLHEEKFEEVVNKTSAIKSENKMIEEYRMINPYNPLNKIKKVKNEIVL